MTHAIVFQFGATMDSNTSVPLRDTLRRVPAMDNPNMPEP